ncbi:MAG: response regulator [Clostridiales bacterium]|nr:response regulator [Clostridiales bacterium]
MIKSKTLRTIFRPIIGVCLLIIIALVFLTLSTLNEELEIELGRAEHFMSLLQADVWMNIDDFRSSLYEFNEIVPMDKILFEMEMTNGDHDLFMKKSKYLMKNQEVIGVSLTDLVDNTSIVSANTNQTFDNYDLKEEMIRWEEDNKGNYRLKSIRVNKTNYLMIEIPLEVQGDYNDYGLGLIVDYKSLVSESYITSEYDVHFIGENGEALRLSEDYKIVNQLQNIYGSEVFNPSGRYERSKDYLSIDDFHYVNQHIVLSEQVNNLNIVLTKAYNKFNIDSLLVGFTIKIIIFAILMIAVIATVIYSSQKTKTWISSEKQFLNDVIVMDKMQISEVNKELKFYKDYLLESILPILIIDKESYRIINVNRAAIDYYEYSEDELTDMFITEICKWDNDVVSNHLTVEHTTRTGKKEQRAVRLQDGVFNDSELIILMVIADQELSMNTDQIKMEMFHEIRSPLQGAFGAVELIEKATSNYGEYTNIIKRSLSNVLMMTNNVLAHGKLSSQHSKVYESEFDLVQLIDEVITTIVYQDKQYNLIAGHVKENIDDIIIPLNSYIMTSDAIKLRQILINLMSNASKYTHDGMVNLNVDIKRKETVDVLVFRISDTGAGLTKEEIDHIYDDYMTYSDNVKVTSTGIGLGITKKYVKMLGSELHISSEKGIGTTFSFSLQVKGTSTSGVPSKDQKSVLIVDDDEISCDYLTHLLEKEMNCYVKTLTNETTLFTELNHNHYDCLIIDQNLNHFNGIDMIKLIKSSINKRLVEMPVILITASRTKHEFKKLSESNLDEIILKPFENDEVINALKEIFNKDDKLKHTACKFVNEEIVDKKIMCETYDSVGKEIFIELVSKFQMNSREELKQINKLLEVGNFDSISGVLHRLKGSMSYFAPIKCKELILILEGLALNRSIAFRSTLDEYEVVHEELLRELQIICRNI